MTTMDQIHRIRELFYTQEKSASVSAVCGTKQRSAATERPM